MYSNTVIATIHNLSAALPAVNNSTTTMLVVLAAFLIILSFSIAGSQAAIFSLDAKDIDVLKTKQQEAAKRIIHLLEEPKEVFTSMLIGKTVSNISIILLANYFFDQYVPPNALPLWSVICIKFIVIAFIIILVEMFPRVWATQNNLRFALEWPLMIIIVQAMHFFLRRISGALVSIAEGIGHGVGAHKAEETSDQQLDEEIDIQTDEEVSPEEKNIMKGIVKFGKISVKKVMRSRLHVSGIPYDTSFSTLVKKIEELHYSRLPVYKDSLDDIAGILNTKDIVPHIYDTTTTFDWHSAIRPPYFVPESKQIDDLLIEFQKKRIHFAVVVDEFGGTSGIVTMEDIIEEVIGDIKDEFDEEENGISQVDANTYIFNGLTRLQDVCRAMKLPLGTFDKIHGHSESVGGLVVELAGELPKSGEVLKSGDFEFTVMDTDKNRVKSVKVVIHSGK